MLWKMCGIDVHMDPNIGKRLNALGNTLTSLTGEEDIDDIADLNSVTMADLSDEDEADSMSPTIHMVSQCLFIFREEVDRPKKEQ